MKSKALKNRIFICAALAAAALCAFISISRALPASANSGPGYYFGVGGTGVYPLEDCPIEVESELLTFNITDYPDLNDFVSYDSTVTARYTFFNPAAEDLTVGMLFPFGSLPDYWTGNEGQFSDSHLFSVTTGENDAPLDFSYRLSYDGRGNSDIGSGFNFNEARQNLLSLPAGDGVLSYESSVTVYERQEGEGEYLVAKFTEGNNFYAFYDGRSCGYDGSQVFIELDEGDELYFAGAVPDDLQFYSRTYVPVGGSDGHTLATAEDTPVAAPEPSGSITFIEFIRRIKPQLFANVSDCDWFNYIVFYMSEHAYRGSESVENLQRGLYTAMRWLEYEVTIPSGGTLINSVTVPVYPDIGIDSEPYTYDYYYYISPAAGWADFGTLTVRINYDGYILHSSAGDVFEAADEGGYTATFEGLPGGELYFTLCSSSNPEYTGYGWAYIVVAIVLLLPVPLLCAIVGLIVTVVIVNRDKKKFLNKKS